MKLLLVFSFITSLAVTLSKKYNKSLVYVQRAESSFETYNDYDKSSVETRSTDKDDYFNYKGTLRRNFALQLAFQKSRSNVICSPVSALMPLGKLVYGAVDESRSELLQMIGVSKLKDVAEPFKRLIKKLQYLPGVTLDLASRIYISKDYELMKSFSDPVKKVFQFSLEKLSFKNPKQATDEINGWVARQTKGMIPLLIQPTHISPYTSMVIVNAVYFNGRWKKPFSHVRVDTFFAPSGSKKLQMMRRDGEYRHTTSKILNSQVLEIPYEGSSASFIIVLPNEKSGLPLLLNQLKLAPNLLNNAMKSLLYKKVDVAIPKFTISTSFDLKEMYRKIGLKSMFSARSGLTGMVKNQELNVTTAIQKAIIEVHELGTEAGAASAVEVENLSYIINKPRFHAKWPFLFFIQANSEQLFAGIFNEP